MRTFWVIKDTGRAGAKMGMYFAGWNKEDIFLSWTNNLAEVRSFLTKKEAFRTLRSEMKQSPVYAPRSAKVRFSVFRVKTNVQPAPKASCLDSKNRVRVRGGGKNVGSGSNPVNEKVGTDTGAADGTCTSPASGVFRKAG